MGPRGRQLKEALEAMTLEQLQDEARRYGLTETENRDVLITAILQHLQLCGPTDLAGEARAERAGPALSRRDRSASVPTLATAAPMTAATLQQALSLVTSSMMNQQMELQRQQQQFWLQQQQKFEEVMRHFATRNGKIRVNPNEHAPGTGGDPHLDGSPEAAAGFSPAYGEGGSSHSSTLNAGRAVSCLASQIPEYGGSEEENVTSWIKRIDRVALIHGATDGVTLLAASSKFTKIAKQWFNEFNSTNRSQEMADN